MKCCCLCLSACREVWLVVPCLPECGERVIEVEVCVLMVLTHVHMDVFLVVKKVQFGANFQTRAIQQRNFSHHINESWAQVEV